VIVFYFGRKGGGVRFTLQILEEILKSGLKVDFFVDSRARYLSSFPKEIMEHENFRIFKMNFMSVKDFHTTIRMLKKQKEFGVRVAINPMMSHRDYPFLLLLSLFRFSRIQVIHDSTRHKGDIYPLTREIRFRAKHATIVWVLSENVQTKIKSFNENILQLNFISGKPVIQRNKPTKSILAIGRGRAYQGLDRIPSIAALTSLNQVCWVTKGESRKKVFSENQTNVWIDFWIGDHQIYDLLNSALFVLLPYYSASQSGVIQQCVTNGIPVVIPPIPGLKEFITHQVNGFIAESNTNYALADACELAYDQIVNKGWTIPSGKTDELLITNNALDSICQLMSLDQHKTIFFDET
jgi:glycosyltransferase involved in cell wall biosynthesis